MTIKADDYGPEESRGVIVRLSAAVTDGEIRYRFVF